MERKRVVKRWPLISVCKLAADSFPLNRPLYPIPEIFLHVTIAGSGHVRKLCGSRVVCACDFAAKFRFRAHSSCIGSQRPSRSPYSEGNKMVVYSREPSVMIQILVPFWRV